jgi:hypothetical protein
MAGKVLPSIETSSDPLSANGSVLSDDTYVEEQGTPEPDDPEARLNWGRKHYGEDWYLERVAVREAAQKARCKEEERERIEDEKVEAIRKLRETEPWEYKRRMREYNLQLQGLTKAQIDKSNQPLPEEVIKSNWKGFSALLQGKVLRKAYKGERASRRLANKPVEYGIFANRSIAPVPKDLQRSPATRKRNPAGPRSKKSIAVEPAKH